MCNLSKCSHLIPTNLIYVLLQSKIPGHVSVPETSINTYLEYFKSINVQHSNVKLLMIFHHGFVDRLKPKFCVTKMFYRLTQFFTCWSLKVRHQHAIVPRPGSRILVSAGPWRGRRECNTPAPRSESRRWTQPHFPTCCPSSGSWVSPLDDSARFQAETRERLELLKSRRGGMEGERCKQQCSLWILILPQWINLCFY